MKRRWLGLLALMAGGLLIMAGAYPDDDFYIFNRDSETKLMRFDASTLAAGQTAKIKIPDPGAGVSYTGTMALLETNNTWAGDNDFQETRVRGELQLFSDATHYTAILPIGSTTINAVLPGVNCNLLGDAASATITGGWTFDATAGGNVTFSSDDPTTAGTALFTLVDPVGGGDIGVYATGAITGAGLQLKIPAAGGTVVTTGTVTSGRIPFFSGTTGLLTNDSDLSFAGDSLVITKVRGTTVRATSTLQVNGGQLLTALTSGTYTPTLTGVANVAASTAYQCQYMQVGSVVTVSGKVDIDPTSAATLTQLGISLPVASNIGATEDCAGTAHSAALAEGGAILGDATNDRAELDFTTVATITNQTWYFTFTYEVL